MQMSSISPSFTSHSSNNLADIAARVVEEFRIENGHDDDDQLDDIYSGSNGFYDDINVADDGFFVSPTENQTEHEDEDKMDEEEEEEKEFEFAVVCHNNSGLYPSSSVSADEIFFNGEIVPRYPLFDQSLLLDDDDSKEKVVGLKRPSSSSPPSSKVVRQPLSMFFNVERDSSTVSCSSSEADDHDLNGAAPGTYCIWKPKEDQSLLDQEKCKKSNSTGNSSKRWKLRNLLGRSNSDRNFNKDDDTASVVVFSPKKGADQKVKKFEKSAKVAGAEDDDKMAERPSQVVVVVNDKSKSNRGGNRLRSIVSFKEDLVGVFSNVNGFKGV